MIALVLHEYILATEPSYEGITNARDHLANFSMQDTVYVHIVTHYSHPG